MTHPVVVSLLASMPDVTVRRACIADDGQYEHGSRTIFIRHGLRGAAWLSTLVHEALHAQRGDQRCAGEIDTLRQESRCERDAAWLLIDIHALGEAAAAYPDDLHAVADQLQVDLRTLHARMRHLHPSERHYLRRRLAHLEETA